MSLDMVQESLCQPRGVVVRSQAAVYIREWLSLSFFLPVDFGNKSRYLLSLRQIYGMDVGVESKAQAQGSATA
jgi:hypothetical protein